MRHILLTIFQTILAFAALCTAASADVKVGPIHQVGDNERLDLWDSRVETTDANGNRVVARSEQGALVLRHLNADGSDASAPVTLGDSRTSDSFALRLDEHRILQASWYGSECKVTIAKFALDGRQIDRRVHTLDPVLCNGQVEVVRGFADDWHLLSKEWPDDESSRSVLRTLRYDWEGIGAYHTIVLTSDDQLGFLYSPVALGPDGTMASVWIDDDTVFGRVWSAEGNPLTDPIEIGVLEYPWYSSASRPLSLEAGRFLLAWKSGGDDAVQWVAREVAIDGGDPTTTTTTTTLPDPTEWPEMSHATRVFDSPWMDWYERHLATDGRNTWVVSWTHWTGGHAGAFVAVSNNSGRTWGSPHYLGRGSDVVAAADADGNWLAGAADCAFNDPDECLWRFWRSSDGAHTWTSNYSPDQDQWIDYVSRPYRGHEFDYHAPRLLSDGNGRWVFAVSARQDLDNAYIEYDTLVFAARSDDDGASWRWVPSTVDEFGGNVEGLDPAIVPFSSGSMVLWKLDTLYGLAVRNFDFTAINRASMLTSQWGEPADFRLYPEGFSAASDADQTAIAAWTGRSVSPQGWGWDPDIVFSRSGDGGANWTQPEPINSYAFDDGAVDERPLIATNRRGGWMAAWSSTYPSAARSLPETSMLTSYSSDDGRTWSPPSSTAPPQVTSTPEYRLEALVGSARGRHGTWGALWTTFHETDERSGLWVQMTAPAGTCGDGQVSRDEACDDGNAVDGDGCDSNCTLSGCGNGVKSAGEECDDGNLSSEDACSASCRLTWCGDGLVRWDTESCDDTNQDDTDGCLSSCQQARCGDGILWAGHEECDDGNQRDDDGCDRNCTITSCGNGMVTAGEECDDANTDNGDDCVSGCVRATCGDGWRHDHVASCYERHCSIPPPLEECDDGNTVDGDGCSSDCRLPVCGDGVYSVLEECDDGNNENGDGCDGNCTLTRCGNGRLTQGEFCDDGNTADGDYCSADCGSFSSACGDADSSGDISAPDALRVLRRAVGLQVDCPRWACDVNGSGGITAVDGSMVLRKAVGLQVEMQCQDRVRVRLTASSLLGALQFRIAYRDGSGSFRDPSGDVRCTVLPAMVVYFFDGGDSLTLGAISENEFRGPLDLADCVFRRFAPPSDNDFSVFVDDAVDPHFEDVRASVKIELVVD